MECPTCGFENREGAKFCNECGASLVPQKTDESIIEEALKEGTLDIQAEEDRAGTEVLFELPDLPEVPGIPEIFNGSAEDGTSFEEQETQLLDPIEELDFTTHEDEDIDYDPFAEHQEDSNEGYEDTVVMQDFVPTKKSGSTGDTMEMPRIDTDETPKQKEFRAPEEKKKGARGKIVALVLLVAILLIALVGAGVTYQLELWGGKSVPDVTGLDKDEATTILEDQGFTVKALQVKSDETEDLVLLMDPGAGGRLQEGSEVVLQVATPRSIPEVVGKPLEEVKTSLSDEGFTNIQIVTEKSDEPKETVLRIDPEEGSSARASQSIVITVADPYLVPEVLGLSTADAKAAIEAEGLVAAESYVYSDEVPEGTIISCNPEVGTTVTSGSTVTISIALSRANELIAATHSIMQGWGGSVQLGNDDGGTTNYVITSDLTNAAISYLGNGTTQATITVAGVTTIDGETVFGSEKQRVVTFVFDDNNNISSYY